MREVQAVDEPAEALGASGLEGEYGGVDVVERSREVDGAEDGDALDVGIPARLVLIESGDGV